MPIHICHIIQCVWLSSLTASAWFMVEWPISVRTFNGQLVWYSLILAKSVIQFAHHNSKIHRYHQYFHIKTWVNISNDCLGVGNRLVYCGPAHLEYQNTKPAIEDCLGSELPKLLKSCWKHLSWWSPHDHQETDRNKSLPNGMICGVPHNNLNAVEQGSDHI